MCCVFHEFIAIYSKARIMLRLRVRVGARVRIRDRVSAMQFVALYKKQHNS